MSEITKLYENAGIRKQEIETCTYKNSMPCGHACDYGEDCPCLDIKDDYPPFTAEKQLNLIILLANREVRISPTYISSGYYLNNISKIKSSRNISTLENSLAQHINAIWQDLTEEEKQQVKGILE